ncbi:MULTISPECIES: glucosaminidase domain-containing protein [unclassified Shewanella]|uniref:glucosaminidase domain-containing protein n=1 Tax=unclassified Shewanella TaxID=196818 RepID=UPI001BBACFDD|nr:MULTISPECIES: glucosaminidase domain-containing protein [unclassified Shewanella]GIU05135.1 glucosaminidase [Shewanella sp. MBTL60-112-B1]GIU24361.1 glucosaminidase [Shewanella sp. MBTL60-112-B2]
MSLAKIIASVILVISPMAFADTNETSAVSLISTQQFPLPPESLATVYPPGPLVELDNGQALMAKFDKNHYQLSSVIATHQLPRYFTENLPGDLNDLPVQQKISVFIRLLLPTIKAVNQQILQVRTKVIALSHKPKMHRTEAEQDWLQGLFDTYGIKSAQIEDLLLQLDIIPTGMVLAQGIDESGWGSSHFAIAGNNLYGEHLPHDGGKYLTTPGGHVKVAAFDNLYQSTASYIHNLNTTLAYKELRQLRQQLRLQNKLTGDELVQSLLHYSSRGQAYVDNLRALIKHHHLDDFDSVKLNSAESIRYRFADSGIG